MGPAESIIHVFPVVLGLVLTVALYLVIISLFGGKK